MTKVALTYRDYAALPDDGRRYELWEGELRELTSPGTRHQRILGNVYRAIDHHVRHRALGEVFLAPLDVILSEITVVQPDVIFIASNQTTAITDRGIDGAPTLVVEILSPSTAAGDRGRKRELYGRYGVPYYWVVDGDTQTVEAYVLAGEAYRLEARLAGTEPVDVPPFEGLELIPAALFPPR